MYMPMNFPFPSDLLSISLLLLLACLLGLLFFVLSLSLTHFSLFHLFVSFGVYRCVYFHIPLSIIRLSACLFAFSFIPFSAYIVHILFILYHSLTFFPRSFWFSLCVYVCVCWCSFGLHFIYFPSSIRRTEIRRRISSCHRRWYKIHEVLALLDIHT